MAPERGVFDVCAPGGDTFVRTVGQEAAKTPQEQKVSRHYYHRTKTGRLPLLVPKTESASKGPQKSILKAPIFFLLFKVQRMSTCGASGHQRR